MSVNIIIKNLVEGGEKLMKALKRYRKALESCDTMVSEEEIEPEETC